MWWAVAVGFFCDLLLFEHRQLLLHALPRNLPHVLCYLAERLGRLGSCGKSDPVSKGEGTGYG
jgi:hypothetical protein